MMEVSEAVKRGVSKLEGATQKSEFLGANLGAKYGLGAIWGQFGGSKKSFYVQ